MDGLGKEDVGETKATFLSVSLGKVLPIQPRNDSFMIGNPVKWNLSIQYFPARDPFRDCLPLKTRRRGCCWHWQNPHRRRVRRSDGGICIIESKVQHTPANILLDGSVRKRTSFSCAFYCSPSSVRQENAEVVLADLTGWGWKYFAEFTVNALPDPRRRDGGGG